MMASANRSTRSEVDDFAARSISDFALSISDTRLALEVAVINTLAHRLTGLLQVRDPLHDKVHLAPAAVAGLSLVGILHGASRRLGRRFFAGAETPRGA